MDKDGKKDSQIDAVWTETTGFSWEAMPVKAKYYLNTGGIITPPLQYLSRLHPSGRIFVLGNHINNSTTCIANFYYYDISANAWFSLPTFPGGGRNELTGAFVNGIWYGGNGHACAAMIRDWWKLCP